MSENLFFKSSEFIVRRDKDGYLVLPKKWDDGNDFEIDYAYDLMLLNLDTTPDETIKKLLDKLKKEFLDTDQVDLYPTFLRWDDTLRLAIDQKASVEDKKFLISDFWNIFKLRMTTDEQTYYIQAQIYKDRLRKIREYYLLKMRYFFTPGEGEIISDLNCSAQKALK
ncbi:MAG: hypothetical protein PHT24_06635 [Endomicrobiaceae bacterium]|nr:hypothetical protein [Endomicrobiaceae bacterium]